jgi:hypothetical protein
MLRDQRVALSFVLALAAASVSRAAINENWTEQTVGDTAASLQNWTTGLTNVGNFSSSAGSIVTSTDFSTTAANAWQTLATGTAGTTFIQENNFQPLALGYSLQTNFELNSSNTAPDGWSGLAFASNDSGTNNAIFEIDVAQHSQALIIDSVAGAGTLTSVATITLANLRKTAISSKTSVFNWYGAPITLTAVLAPSSGASGYTISVYGANSTSSNQPVQLLSATSTAFANIQNVAGVLDSNFPTANDTTSGATFGDAVFTSVPEPGGFSGVSLAGLSLLSRRRRNSQARTTFV